MKNQLVRPQPPETVRVLLVDDEVDELRRQAAIFLEADPNVFRGAALHLEVTNSAYFAAANLLRRRHPRWDVVIADVFMPPPKPRVNGAVEHTAEVDSLTVSGRKIPFFKYTRHTWAGPENATPHDGGMMIADVVRTKRARNRALVDFKLILVSRFGHEPIQRRIHELRSTDGEWFDYFDKAYWPAGKKGGTLEPRVYILALAQAIANRHSKAFGAAVLAETRALVGRFIRRSALMQRIEVEARSLASSSAVRNIWLSGERGVGRRTVASLIHRHKTEMLAKPDASIVEFNIAAIAEHEFEPTLLGSQVNGPRGTSETPGALQSAANGTLLIRNAEKLRNPYQWDVLVNILRRSEIRRRDGGVVNSAAVPLVILSTTAPEADSFMSMFDKELLHELSLIPRLEVPPLRAERQADISAFALEAAHHVRPTLTIADETEAFLETQDWKDGNVNRLIHVVTMAAVRETGPILKLPAVQAAVEEIAASIAVSVRPPTRSAKSKSWPPEGVKLDAAEQSLLDAVTYLRELRTIVRDVANSRRDQSLEEIRKKYFSYQVIHRLFPPDFEGLKQKGIRPSELALKFAGERYGEITGENARSPETMRDWRDRKKQMPIPS